MWASAYVTTERHFSVTCTEVQQEEYAKPSGSVVLDAALCSAFTWNGEQMLRGKYAGPSTACCQPATLPRKTPSPTAPPPLCLSLTGRAS